MLPYFIGTSDGEILLWSMAPASSPGSLLAVWDNGTSDEKKRGAVLSILLEPKHKLYRTSDKSVMMYTGDEFGVVRHLNNNFAFP